MKMSNNSASRCSQEVLAGFEPTILRYIGGHLISIQGPTWHTEIYNYLLGDQLIWKNTVLQNQDVDEILCKLYKLALSKVLLLMEHKKPLNQSLNVTMFTHSSQYIILRPFQSPHIKLKVKANSRSFAFASYIIRFHKFTLWQQACYKWPTTKSITNLHSERITITRCKENERFDRSGPRTTERYEGVNVLVLPRLVLPIQHVKNVEVAHTVAE